MKRTIRKKMKVVKFDKDFSHERESAEKCVACYSHVIKELSFEGSDSNNCEEDYPIETLVKIKNPISKKVIYRKAIGYSAIGSKDNIMIGYRSRKKLGVKEGADVIITKTNWFFYLWNHPETTVKYPFIVATVFGIVSLLFDIIGVLKS